MNFGDFPRNCNSAPANSRRSFLARSVLRCAKVENSGRRSHGEQGELLRASLLFHQEFPLIKQRVAPIVAVGNLTCIEYMEAVHSELIGLLEGNPILVVRQ